jgi:hypothetical protein
MQKPGHVQEITLGGWVEGGMEVIKHYEIIQGVKGFGQ